VKRSTALAFSVMLDVFFFYYWVWGFSPPKNPVSLGNDRSHSDRTPIKFLSSFFRLSVFLVSDPCKFIFFAFF